ncbi:hypothetical protein K438DRAFT_1762924 [Mycena galopus ATCC 62051]|nr:hypothetical protein K438DRAFT_1762924 [Mycena galopus ATCC 62051]
MPPSLCVRARSKASSGEKGEPKGRGGGEDSEEGGEGEVGGRAVAVQPDVREFVLGSNDESSSDLVIYATDASRISTRASRIRSARMRTRTTRRRRIRRRISLRRRPKAIASTLAGRAREEADQGREGGDEEAGGVEGAEEEGGGAVARVPVPRGGGGGVEAGEHGEEHYVRGELGGAEDAASADCRAGEGKGRVEARREDIEGGGGDAGGAGEGEERRGGKAEGDVVEPRR